MRLLSMGLASALFMVLAPAAHAAVINVDFERPGDATHSGADGAQSTTGTQWNQVLFDQDKIDLADEFGVTTAIALTHSSSLIGAPGPYEDPSALNNLQNSGVTSDGFRLLGLIPDSTYSLVIYSAANTGFTIIDGSGLNGGSCTGSAPTYVLPGAEGQDFCVFPGLVPLEFEPGVFGIQLSGLGVSITGLQLVGGPASGGGGGDPEPVAGCPAVLDFFDQAVAAGTLSGSGPGRSAPGRLGALRNMLEDACSLIDAESYEDACAQLAAAYKHCDGDPGVPEFAGGEAGPQLASMIVELGFEICPGANRAVGLDPFSSARTTTVQSVTWALMKVLYESGN